MNDKSSRNNVVLFPGMVERLIENAHDAVKQSRYVDAIELIDEVLKYEKEDEFVLSLLVHSLYETKQFEEAKDACERLLELKPIHYFEVMELYLTICMQLKQFQMVNKLIHSMFDDGIIPKERAEMFHKIQRLNNEIADKSDAQFEEVYEGDYEEFYEDDKESIIYNAEAFLEMSFANQLIEVQKLSDINIRPYVDPIKNILSEESVHPFVQSLLLIALVEQQINVEIVVRKFGLEVAVNPSTLSLPTQMEQSRQVLAQLAEHFEQNPSTLEIIESIVIKHAIVLYPFGWEPYSSGQVMDGYIRYAQAMFSDEEVIGMDEEDFLNKIFELENLSDLM